MQITESEELQPLPILATTLVSTAAPGPGLQTYPTWSQQMKTMMSRKQYILANSVAHHTGQSCTQSLLSLSSVPAKGRDWLLVFIHKTPESGTLIRKRCAHGSLHGKGLE